MNTETNPWALKPIYRLMTILAVIATFNQRRPVIYVSAYFDDKPDQPQTASYWLHTPQSESITWDQLAALFDRPLHTVDERTAFLGSLEELVGSKVRGRMSRSKTDENGKTFDNLDLVPETNNLPGDRAYEFLSRTGKEAPLPTAASVLSGAAALT